MRGLNSLLYSSDEIQSVLASAGKLLLLDKAFVEDQSLLSISFDDYYLYGRLYRLSLLSWVMHECLCS